MGPGALCHWDYYTCPLSVFLALPPPCLPHAPVSVPPERSFQNSALRCSHQWPPFTHGANSHCDMSSTYLLLGDPLSWALSILGCCPSYRVAPQEYLSPGLLPGSPKPLLEGHSLPANHSSSVNLMGSLACVALVRWSSRG